ncbi:hypothetical protein AMS68_004905 [Peltaster fructicola]|uniref:Methylated-DNA--protein-cysteine methyltransferase n=1 Tax=Peltaster fructicola TaxID=286661 RepID=A0A6H0XXR7_9PEZI|nr:hypothetical protein AMS68_004905 [Peltaster fructicola]
MSRLEEQWRQIYAVELPALAKARDTSQKHWPVYLDHCFARIILDNAVGIDRPWTEAIKSPAIKNMTEDQLRAAIELAQSIISGTKDLDVLNQRSLDLRGKTGSNKKKRKAAASEELRATKSKRTESGNISTYFLPSPQSPEKNTLATAAKADASVTDAAHAATEIDMDVQLKRIAGSKLTAFRKQTLSMLCQVPRGRYSTYQAMSDFITKSSHKTCARAVGNAMRNNPFAPEVPCHRILAADGTLGGFSGHWGEDGKFAKEKHKLLDDEGVRFDSRGKVKGPPFPPWHDMHDTHVMQGLHSTMTRANNHE